MRQDLGDTADAEHSTSQANHLSGGHAEALLVRRFVEDTFKAIMPSL